MRRDELDALGVELMSADEAADSRRLAAIAWQLYSEAGVTQAEVERLHSLLRCVTPVIGWPAAGPAGTARR
ncbi:MAG TPA: hypothetical protein VEL03_17090 [Streptosporangiaceae bacterium]|nr:hypothetical protein [Streptosporangiaceae bacterium]